MHFLRPANIIVKYVSSALAMQQQNLNFDGIGSMCAWEKITENVAAIFSSERNIIELRTWRWRIFFCKLTSNAHKKNYSVT